MSIFSKPLSGLHSLPFSLLLLLLLPSHGDALKPRTPGTEGSVETTVLLPQSWRRTLSLVEGQKVEVTAGIPRPSTLPPHARVGIRWSLLGPTSQPIEADVKSRVSNKLEIDTLPTANWQKTLHALDPDVHLVYRAPVKGEYQLEVSPVLEGPTPFEGIRWRETGSAPSVAVFPRKTPWPPAKTATVTVSVRPFNLGDTASKPGLEVETEPNDTPEMAQPLTLPMGEGIQRLLISAGADDIEYFDNGKVSNSGEDWFRFTYEGQEPRLLTCSLAIPDQTLAARLRLYSLDAKDQATAQQLLSKLGLSGALLPIMEYTEGRNENERVHQQNEGHRSEINRLLKPGQTYFLRAEANAPGYEIELRLLRPAPYDDPRMAVRQALYDHLGQVDAWLANRPRGASVERRIRDTGNLMGTHCMSCHTQSGVWGPAVAVENGYKPENLQQIRRLINIMYESMRPTNYLKDAANNTSLAPLDVGDGPAGTRVAGHNVCTAERVWPARKLHSMQAIRAANHVLQTADPSGINAAGPGSNVGQSVVYNYAGEILRTAWDRTGHPRYFAALEEKADKMLAVQPKYTDDLAHRIEFFQRFFPKDYLDQNRKARKAQQALPPPPAAPTPVPAAAAPAAADKTPKPAEFPAYTLLDADAAQKLLVRIQEQLVKDEARLRAVQNSDGTWGFDPGKLGEDGKTWKTDGQYDPAPTALGLIALQALGHGTNDSAIARGVKALLSKQDPYGRWNKTAQTGFVTTAYALHALARLYPETPEKLARSDFEAKPQENLRAKIARVRALSHSGEAAFADLMIQAVQDSSPWVRYWGAMGLGGIHSAKGAETLVNALGDRVKMVRDAAAWAMEQTLLDDAGFTDILEAFARGDDLTRESIVKALGIRADAVMTQPRFNKASLAQLLAKALNDDPHPGVRAWAAKAAWQWWVWNPPLREPIQRAWTRKLLSPESNALVENCVRYQSHALFIANGHKANASEEHQYPELSLLFKSLESRLDDTRLADAVKDRLARRLVAVAGTFFNTTGGDGGPGQMGYVTPGSSNVFGRAAFRYFQQAEAAKDLPKLRLVLEGAAGIPYTPLQDRLIDYSTSGPEELRTLAAAAVSDPSTVTLPGTQELVQPLVDQIMRGAQDYDRRQTLAQPVLKLFSRARWSVPKTTEQQLLLYSFLVPKYVKEPDAQSVAGIRAAAERAIQPMGQLDADWYIADRMGKMLAANPDLHTETLLSRIPSAVKNPLEAHFWLPSVSWVFDFGEPVPEIGGGQGPTALPPAVATARERALAIYLQTLAPDAVGLSRNAAAGLTSLTALRRQAAVMEEMRKLLKSEKNDRVRQAAENLLRSEPQRWLADLKETAKAEPSAASLRQGTDAKLSPEFIASFQYFSDYVTPELNRPQRMDEMACMSCHGVPGRVPSMQLEPPDSTGHFSVAKLLKNYLTLQQRINLPSIEQSKLLRKPLNVQTGKEDGHQGGRRYLPAERGYQIIRRWVLDQPRVQMSLHPNGNSQQAGR